MNKHILDPQVQQFIQLNLHTDLAKLALSKSPFNYISSAELAEQIAGKKTAEKKLPTWFNTSGIYFPPKLAIEQSSSELTAEYKSRLIKGKSLVDLTGGMGVDSFYFSKKAQQVLHLEKQAELSAIAQYNSSVLGAPHIDFKVVDAQQWLQSNTEQWGTIYIDPSRRVAGQKVFKLSDCEPNVVALQTDLFKHSSDIIVKTAPLLDIKLGLSELKNVAAIHIVSVNNEMKEILWLINKDFEGQEPQITCVSLNSTAEQSFSFKISEEKDYQIQDFADIQTYLYEPDAAWLKAGCFKLISKEYGLGKVHQHTHLYSSESLNIDFPGRKFRVKQVWNYTDYAKQNPISQANVISRNFPLNPNELQKKHKIKDGGNIYLLFCTNKNQQLIVIAADRL